MRTPLAPGTPDGRFPLGPAPGRLPRAVALLALLMLWLGGCAALPVLTPLDPDRYPAAREACSRPFLAEPHRLVHSLEASLPDGSRVTAIGVLAADPVGGRLRSILMTLEGWVLFDIETGEPPTVHRGVPPFDAPGFARRMTGDIALAFFAPVGMPLAWENRERGEILCRFPERGGHYVEVQVREAGAAEVRLYETGGALQKRVLFPALAGPGLAEALEIRAEGFPSYGLRLRLLEGAPLGDAAGAFLGSGGGTPPPGAGR